MSHEIEWIVTAHRPKAQGEIQVERHPALAKAEQGKRYAPLSKPVEVQVADKTFRLDQSPYLLAIEGKKPVAALSIAMSDDDLLLLGYGGCAELSSAGVGDALIEEAVRVAAETGRRRLIAPVTNADVLALFFLQTKGFTVDAVRPYAGPAHTGAADIPATHELVLVRPLG